MTRRLIAAAVLSACAVLGTGGTALAVGDTNAAVDSSAVFYSSTDEIGQGSDAQPSTDSQSPPHTLPLYTDTSSNGTSESGPATSAGLTTF